MLRLKIMRAGFEKIAKYFSPRMFTTKLTAGCRKQAVAKLFTRNRVSRSALYSAATEVPIPVEDFKALVWDTDRTQLYKNTLDGFWDKHSASYASLSKISFVKAINLQRLEGTLGPGWRAALAQRALGGGCAKGLVRADGSGFYQACRQGSGIWRSAC